MVGLLKLFWILRLNSLVIVPLPLIWNTYKFFRFLIGTPIGFYITQNRLNMRKIWGLKVEV